MEEVQSWWEVPAVAHFCYVFRSAFNLIYYEIAELESALLNVQDPEMSISLETLIMRLLQGFENETITTENWDENLHELFNDNLEDEENPYDKALQFYQLSPRQKLDVLYKLCEMRLDVVDAMDKIKDIKIQDMKAQCLGKDNEKCKYWYFYDERLYKEMAGFSLGKKTKVLKEKNTKCAAVTARNKEMNKRERLSRATSKVDSPWSIVCFCLSDWEALIIKFSKSKNSQEKDLANNLKEQLPLVQESISEKDRLLRKRFTVLAPKRQSSRILREQEKKREQDLKAQQEAERRRNEMMAKKALMEKQRQKAIASERADRLRLRAKLKSASESENEAPKSKQAKTDVMNKSQQKYESYADSKGNKHKKHERKQKRRTSSRYRAKYKSFTESEDSNSESEVESVKTKLRMSTRYRAKHKSFSESEESNRESEVESVKAKLRTSTRYAAKHKSFSESEESNSESEVESVKAKLRTSTRYGAKHKSFSESEASNSESEVESVKTKLRMSSRLTAKHKPVTESEEINSESDAESVKTKQRVNTYGRGKQNTGGDNGNWSDFSKRHSKQTDPFKIASKKQQYLKPTSDSDDERSDHSEEDVLRMRQTKIAAMYKHNSKDNESHKVLQLKSIKNEVSSQSDSEGEESSDESEEESFNIRLKKMIAMNQQNIESVHESGVTDKSESSEEENHDLSKKSVSKPMHMAQSDSASEAEESDKEGEMIFKVSRTRIKGEKMKTPEHANYPKSGSGNQTQACYKKSALTTACLSSPQRAIRLRQGTKRVKSVDCRDGSGPELEPKNDALSKSAQNGNRSVNCIRTSLRTKRAKAVNQSYKSDHEHFGKYAHSSNGNSHKLTDKPVVISCSFPNRSKYTSNTEKMSLQNSSGGVCTWSPPLVSKVKKFPIIIRSYRSTSPGRLKMNEVRNVTAVTSMYSLHANKIAVG